MKKGFTLAEVLITLGIIGVVAAMTIPTVISNAQNAQLASGLKKFYSVISQATASIKSDNGGYLGGGFGVTSTDMLNTYASKMAFTKTCPTGGACFHQGTTAWHDLNGNVGWGDYTTFPSGILQDGMMFAVRLSNPNCDHPNDGTVRNDFCGSIFVDVNGFKKPNVEGRDLFEFQLTKNGIYPRGSMDDMSDISQYCTPGVTPPMNYPGVACATRILTEGSMNY